MFKKFKNLFKYEVVSFYCNLFLGFLFIIIILYKTEFWVKFPVLIIFLVFYYFSFFVFCEAMRNNRTFLRQISIILAWLIFVTFTIAFIASLILDVFSPDMYSYNLLQSIVYAIIGASMGLFVTSPMWGGLAIINLIIFRKHRYSQ